MNIDLIKSLCQENKLQWTNHILVRLLQRNITISDVKEAIQSGKIIEKYPDDYPHPSCLILGITLNQQNLHIVCGIDKDLLWLITAYKPSINEWDETFTERRRRNKND